MHRFIKGTFNIGQNADQDIRKIDPPLRKECVKEEMEGLIPIIIIICRCARLCLTSIPPLYVYIQNSSFRIIIITTVSFSQDIRKIDPLLMKQFVKKEMEGFIIVIIIIIIQEPFG